MSEHSAPPPEDKDLLAAWAIDKSITAAAKTIADAIDRLAVVLAENNEVFSNAIDVGIYPALNELVGEVQGIKDTLRGGGPTMLP